MDDHNLDVLQMKSQLDHALQNFEPKPLHTQKNTILMMILTTMVQYYEPSTIEPFPNRKFEHKWTQTWHMCIEFISN
jgi:hypothetical protein